MREKINVDILIIGAGIVGCAIARELSLKSKDKKIIVIEKLEEPGLETSSKNSGVLHSGIHQNSNFLKSRLAKKGSKMVANYARKNDLSILDSGMIIVINRRAILKGLYKELDSLWNLFKNARKHNIKLKFLTLWGVKKLAPNIKSLGGIFIQDVWVVDSLQLTESFYKDAKNNGVEFIFNNSVEKIDLNSSFYSVYTKKYMINTKTVINSAGLYAFGVVFGRIPEYAQRMSSFLSLGRYCFA